MGKFWVLAVFIVVMVAHVLVLQTYLDKEVFVVKPKAKVHRITLSSVILKKPIVMPQVEPIILPPEPEPMIEEVRDIVDPIILPPEPEVVKPKRIKKKKKHKRKQKKKVHKKVLKKPIIKQEPIIEELIATPVVEQVIAPSKMVDTSSIKDAYTSQIRRQIKLHLYYPKMAKRMRMQGVIKVSFLVLEDGKIRDISVLSGTKSILKKAAIKTIKSLRLEPLPSPLGRTMRVTVPVGFNIKGL